MVIMDGDIIPADPDKEAYDDFAARYAWARKQHDSYYSAACVLSGRLRYMEKRAKAANMRADKLEKAMTDKPTPEQREAQSKFWPGFIVQCEKCSGFNINMDNTMGWSEISGSWGSIDLVCQDCNTRTMVVDS